MVANVLHDTVAHYHLRSLKGDVAINAIPTISIAILADRGRILNIIKTTAINANIIPITYRNLLSFLFTTS